MSVRLAVAVAVLLVALGWTEQARAQTGEAVLETETHWYGPKTALAYGGSYALILPGFLLTRPHHVQGVRLFGFVLFGSGLVGTLLLVPVTHWSHDNFALGLVSLGAQIGSVFAGGLTGVAIARGAGSDELATAGFLGAVAGHATWAAVDILALSRQERFVSATTTARLQPYFEPMGRGGFGAGLRLTGW